MKRDRYIYKVLTGDQWEEFQRNALGAGRSSRISLQICQCQQLISTGWSRLTTGPIGCLTIYTLTESKLRA